MRLDQKSSDTPSDAPLGEQLVLEFKKIRAEQLALCDSLEDVADQLGAQPNRSRCTLMAGKLGPTMLRAHSFETDTLFPFLAEIIQKKDGERERAVKRSLTQLKLEHDDDVCLVDEVVEALQEFGHGSSAVSSDAIGYLLRGLFVGLRRHLAHENEVVRSVTTIN